MEISVRGLAVLAAALERLGIRYFVSGGLASATHGQPRLTEDVDLVIELGAEQVDALKRELGADFEVDEIALSDAARAFASDNIFYLPDFTRFDLHVAKRTEFVQLQLERRRLVELPGSGGIRVAIATAEDIVLSKLEWYRKGNEVSTKQWEDILGILRVRAGDLDQAYMQAWAQRLCVSDLLMRALREGDLPKPPLK